MCNNNYIITVNPVMAVVKKVKAVMASILFQMLQQLLLMIRGAVFFSPWGRPGLKMGWSLSVKVSLKV